MTKSAIILAGGMGTRLKSVIQDIPKPMAPVNGQPFLTYVLDYLAAYGITEVVLSVGYRYEVILAHFGYDYKDISIRYSIEHEPLGTGGAIYQATKLLQETSFFAMNGDSLFKVDLSELADFAKTKEAAVALALKEMWDIDRYGIVDIDEHQRVKAFKEKQPVAYGLINGGVYWMTTKAFKVESFPKRFSFEKDFLEKHTETLKMYACPLEGYFIDIGIPTDYAKAQLEIV